MMDFDFPAVQIHLQQWDGGGALIGSQQKGRTPVAESAVFSAPIWDRSYHQQPEPSWPCPALPQYLFDFFEAQLPALAAMPEWDALPRQALVLTDLLRCELLLRIPSTGAGRSRSAQPHIGPRAAEQVEALHRRAEQCAVAQAAIACDQQGAGLRSGLSQPRSPPGQPLDCLPT